MTEVNAVAGPATSSGIWYRADLASDRLAADEVATICRLFADAVAAAGNPDGACLFATTRDAGGRGLHEEAAGDEPVAADALFFSPASVSAVPHLIVRYAAYPSGPPGRVEAAMLVGRESDWNLLPRASH